MPVATTLAENGVYVHHLFTGEISKDDIIDAYDESLKISDLKADTSVIWEFRKVSLPNLTDTVNQVRAIADYIKENSRKEKSNYKVALVAADDLVFGLARMYQSVATFLPVEFMVFRKFTAAEDWVANTD